MRHLPVQKKKPVKKKKRNVQYDGVVDAACLSIVSLSYAFESAHGALQNAYDKPTIRCLCRWKNTIKVVTLKKKNAGAASPWSLNAGAVSPIPAPKASNVGRGELVALTPTPPALQSVCSSVRIPSCESRSLWDSLSAASGIICISHGFYTTSKYT